MNTSTEQLKHAFITGYRGAILLYLQIRYNESEKNTSYNLPMTLCVIQVLIKAPLCLQCQIHLTRIKVEKLFDQCDEIVLTADIKTLDRVYQT